MIGKLIGKTVGAVIALPAIVGSEAATAVDEAGKTFDKAWDRFERGPRR